LVHLMAKMR